MLGWVALGFLYLHDTIAKFWKASKFSCVAGLFSKTTVVIKEWLERKNGRFETQFEFIDANMEGVR